MSTFKVRQLCYASFENNPFDFLPDNVIKVGALDSAFTPVNSLAFKILQALFPNFLPQKLNRMDIP